MFVDDHVRVLKKVLTHEMVKEARNIRAHSEHQNIDEVRVICALRRNWLPARGVPS